jgi:4-amino-4-deoxy-L-arabinose transferase-like glycosyltransferase
VVTWVFFVFIFFFLNLYAGWTSFIPVFPSASFSRGSADLIRCLSFWGNSFLALATGCLVMGILWSCGKRLFHCFSLEAPQSIRFCIEIGLGLFLLNSLWMGLGLVRLWMESLWLIGFVLLTILFLIDVLKIRREGISLRFPQGLNFWLALICGFYMFFLFLHSLLPETFYDSLNYFLGMPAFWLWHHGICDYPTHLLSGYFHGGSLFFLNGFVLAGTEGAKVLVVLVLFWTALFCRGLAVELGGQQVGAMAAMAVLTFPLLYLNSWAVRVDGLLTFVLLLFFYTVEKGVSEKEGKNWIVVAGIFAGLALSIKPTAIVALGAALLALLWRDGLSALKTRGWEVFSGILVLEVGPWLLKNACFAGNAFFPYAISWMGGRQFPTWSYARLLHENQQFLPMNQGILSILTLPWRLTIPGAGDNQFIGPVLLAFLPLFLFMRFKDPALKFLGRTLLLSFVFGLTLSHMLRFSMFAFILAFLVLSATVGALKEERWKALLTSAIVVSAILCISEYLFLSTRWYDGWEMWSGRESRQEYLARKISPAGGALSEWVNHNLPKDAQLLVVGDAQVLYYDRPVYANSVFDEQFFAAAARKENDAAGILQRLKELGITYVVFDQLLGVVNSREYHQYELKKDEWRKLDDFVQKGLEPIVIENTVSLYRVSDALRENGSRVPNPFFLYPSQASDFLNDLSDKNYSKAKLELNQLKDFFPGEEYWVKKESEFNRMEKVE